MATSLSIELSALVWIPPFRANIQFHEPVHSHYYDSWTRYISHIGVTRITQISLAEVQVWSFAPGRIKSGITEDWSLPIDFGFPSENGTLMVSSRIRKCPATNIPSFFKLCRINLVAFKFLSAIFTKRNEYEELRMSVGVASVVFFDSFKNRSIFLLLGYDKFRSSEATQELIWRSVLFHFEHRNGTSICKRTIGDCCYSGFSISISVISYRPYWVHKFISCL